MSLLQVDWVKMVINIVGCQRRWDDDNRNTENPFTTRFRVDSTDAATIAVDAADLCVRRFLPLAPHIAQSSFAKHTLVNTFIRPFCLVALSLSHDCFALLNKLKTFVEIECVCIVAIRIIIKRRCWNCVTFVANRFVVVACCYRQCSFPSLPLLYLIILWSLRRPHKYHKTFNSFHFFLTRHSK